MLVLVPLVLVLQLPEPVPLEPLPQQAPLQAPPVREALELT